MAGPRLTQRPSPYSAVEPSLVGAPAFSSPPASQQQQWQKVRLDGALEAQRRGPPPRDAGDADGGGGGGGDGGGGDDGDHGGGDLPFMPDHDEQDQTKPPESTADNAPDSELSRA